MHDIEFIIRRHLFGLKNKSNSSLLEMYEKEQWKS